MGLWSSLRGMFSSKTEPKPQDRRAQRDQWRPRVGEKTISNISAIGGRQWFLPWVDTFTGETQEMRLIYRKMLKNPIVKSALMSKVLGVASLERNFEPADPNSPRDQEAADFIAHVADNLYEGYVAKTAAILTTYLVDGWVLGEKVIDVESRGMFAGKIVIRDIKPKDTMDVRVEIDEFNNVLSFQDIYQPEKRYPKRDFVYARHLPLFDNPFGMSDFRAIYGPYWMLDTVTKLRAIHAEKNTSGVVVGEYPENNPDAQSSLESALENIRTATWMSIPEGTRVYALDISASAEGIYKSFIDDCKRDILIGVVGAYLQTLEGQIQDARGDTKVQKSIVELFQWYLAVAYEEIWNKQIIPDLIDYNYTGCGYPRLVLGGVNQKDIQDLTQTYQGALQLGLSLSKKDVYKQLSIQRPDTNDPEDLLMPPNQQQGMGMGGGLGGLFGGGDPSMMGADPMAQEPALPFSEQPESDGLATAIIETFLDLEIAKQEGTIEPEEYDYYRDLLEDLLEGEDYESFSWQPAQTRKKTLKAVWTGEGERKPLYGQDALDALNQQRDSSFKRDYTRTQSNARPEQAKFNRQNIEIVKGTVGKVQQGQATRADARDLAFRITRLPLAELKQIKQQLQIESTYIRSRGEYIAYIRDYLKGVSSNGKPGITAGTDDGESYSYPYGRTPVGEKLGKIITARSELTPTADPGLVPERLVGSLRDHQIQATAASIDSIQKNGAFFLADGAGTGKTSVQIATAQAFADQGKKVLIVSQNMALRPNWLTGEMTGSFDQDAKRMGVEIALNNGTKPLEPGKIAITTYAKLERIVGKVDKDTIVILDEAHSLKNADAKQSIAGRKIMDASGGVMFNTATPGDDPVQLAYLARTRFQGDKKIEEAYAELVKWKGSIDRGAKGKTKQIYQAVKGMFDSLTEKGVMLKREISMEGVNFGFEEIPLPPEGRERLAQIKAEIQKKYPNAPGIVAVQSLRVQRESQEKFKVPAVVEGVQQELAEGRQVVIFVSRVTPDANGPGTPELLRKALEAKGITDIVELHTKSKTKSRVAQGKFQSGQARVIISTVGSGGTGINLDDDIGDRPRTLFMVTPPFSAVENVQAVGRVWRLNSRSYPKVRYLLADTDVDRWNAELVRRKVGLLNATVQGEVSKINIPQFAEEDWEGPFKGKRGGTYWLNRKSKEVEYSATNPGGGSGDDSGKVDPAEVEQIAQGSALAVVEANRSGKGREVVQQFAQEWEQGSADLPEEVRSEVGARIGKLAEIDSPQKAGSWMKEFAGWLGTQAAGVVSSIVSLLGKILKPIAQLGAGIGIHFAGIALGGAAIAAYAGVAAAWPAAGLLGAWPAAKLVKTLIGTASGVGQQVAQGKRFRVVGDGQSFFSDDWEEFGDWDQWKPIMTPRGERMVSPSGKRFLTLETYNRMKSSAKTAKTKPIKPSIDELTKEFEMVQKGGPESSKAYLDKVLSLTVPEINELKKILGISAGGKKSEIATKIAEEASRERTKREEFIRKAKVAGISQKDFISTANSVYRESMNTHKEYVGLLEYTRKHYQVWTGKRLNRNLPAFRKGDETNLEAWDVVSDHVFSEFRHLFSESSREGFSSKLFEMVAAGNPTPPARSESYEIALQMAGSFKPQKKIEDLEEAPF